MIKWDSMTQKTLSVQMRRNFGLAALSSGSVFWGPGVSGAFPIVVSDGSTVLTALYLKFEDPCQREVILRNHMRALSVALSCVLYVDKVSPTPKSTPVADIKYRIAIHRFGSRYGYEDPVSIPDCELSRPPNKGPRSIPVLAHSGSSVSARARYLEVFSRPNVEDNHI